MLHQTETLPFDIFALESHIQVADADRAVRESAAVADRVSQIDRYRTLFAPELDSEARDRGFNAGQSAVLYDFLATNPYHPIQQVEDYLDWEEGHEDGFCAAGGRDIAGICYGCDRDADPFAA